MSDFRKKLNWYRGGEDWRANFKYVDVHNVENSLRSILNKREHRKVYDRLGNHVASVGPPAPISQDEMIFRIMVLMDTQYEDTLGKPLM